LYIFYKLVLYSRLPQTAAHIHVIWCSSCIYLQHTMPNCSKTYGVKLKFILTVTLTVILTVTLTEYIDGYIDSIFTVTLTVTLTVTMTFTLRQKLTVTRDVGTMLRASKRIFICSLQQYILQYNSVHILQ